MKIANIVPDQLGVTFNWSDGKATSFDVDLMPAAIADRAVRLGVATKLQNAYAGGASRGWSISDCRKATEDLWAQICEGEWESRSAAGIWVEAIARAMNQTVEEVAGAWAKMDEKQRAKVRKHPKVAGAKLDIERERLDAMESDVDLEDLLG